VDTPSSNQILIFPEVFETSETPVGPDIKHLYVFMVETRVTNETLHVKPVTMFRNIL
jgi:hypothetical protein